MISVIVVTKNSQKHLKQCLYSILMQKFRPLEIIIVDANSNDNTMDIAVKANIEAEFKRNIIFRFIDVSSKTSIGKARQIGAENSQYEILAYVDSDVELPHENWLLHMSTPLLDWKVAGVQTLAKCRDTDPEILKKVHSSFEYKNTVIDINHYEIIGTSHLLIRKSLVKEVGGFIDVSMGEDTDLTDKIMKLGYSFVYLPDEKCYHHHISNYWDYLKKSYRNYKHYFKTKFGETFGK
jgi:glycosyltransferase involved in cell wall biosynthesis